MGSLIIKALLWGSTAYFASEAITSVGDNFTSISHDNVTSEAIASGVIDSPSDFDNLKDKWFSKETDNGYTTTDYVKVALGAGAVFLVVSAVVKGKKLI